MPVTSLRVPTLADVKGFNAETDDGDGSLRVPDDDGEVADIFEMKDPIFQFNAMGYDYGNPLVLGLAWAYLIANKHIFTDGNKSTAVRVLKFIVENNGKRFVCDDDALMDAVSEMVPGEKEEVDQGAIGDAVAALEGSCV